jgi:hypothetical protein
MISVTYCSRIAQTLRKPTKICTFCRFYTNFCANHEQNCAGAARLRKRHCQTLLDPHINYVTFLICHQHHMSSMTQLTDDKNDRWRSQSQPHEIEIPNILQI